LQRVAGRSFVALLNGIERGDHSREPAVQIGGEIGLSSGSFDNGRIDGMRKRPGPRLALGELRENRERFAGFAESGKFFGDGRAKLGRASEGQSVLKNDARVANFAFAEQLTAALEGDVANEAARLVRGLLFREFFGQFEALLRAAFRASFLNAFAQRLGRVLQTFVHGKKILRASCSSDEGRSPSPLESASCAKPCKSSCIRARRAEASSF